MCPGTPLPDAGQGKLIPHPLSEVLLQPAGPLAVTLTCLANSAVLHVHPPLATHTSFQTECNLLLWVVRSTHFLPQMPYGFYRLYYDELGAFVNSLCVSRPVCIASRDHSDQGPVLGLQSWGFPVYFRPSQQLCWGADRQGLDLSASRWSPDCAGIALSKQSKRHAEKLATWGLSREPFWVLKKNKRLQTRAWIKGAGLSTAALLCRRSWC